MSRVIRDDQRAKEIGQKIEQRRIELNLSRSQLASLTHLSRDAIGRFERGERIPEGQSRRALCSFFGMSESELIGEEVDNTEPLPKIFLDLDKILRQEKIVESTYRIPFGLKQQIQVTAAKHNIPVSKLVTHILRYGMQGLEGR